MLYNVEKKALMLDTLNNRVSNIIDVCIALLGEGYELNKNKQTKIAWLTLMIEGFTNIDVLSIEQHENLETLYNKIMAL